ncbi:fumarylacetoacetate hydrolase family protein [Vibrio sp. PP-XX7]
MKTAILNNVLSTLETSGTFSFSQVTLLPVIPNPNKIFCVGHNYESHRKETGRDKVAHPSIFTRFADSLTAHSAEILIPSVSTHLDYEGELAAIIGKGGVQFPKLKQ